MLRQVILKISRELNPHYVETRYPIEIGIHRRNWQESFRKCEEDDDVGKGAIEKIKESVRKLAQQKNSVEKVILFGSPARGKMKKDSDIDIIVVSRKYGRKDVFKITPKLYRNGRERKDRSSSV